MGLSAFNAQMDNASFSVTQKREDTIKDALVTYLRANRRLPCPEITGLAGNLATPPIGRENRTNGVPPDPAFGCSSYVGTLPWLDLGLPRDAVLDGYGNFFSYYVTSEGVAASDPGWTRTRNQAAATPVTGFSVGAPGRFPITHNGQTTGVDSNFNPLPPLAAVVVVSHGKNGFGAITEKGTRNVGSADPNESVNEPPGVAKTPTQWFPQLSPYQALGMRPPSVIPKDKTLVSGSITAGGTFDDIVLVLRPSDLLTPIIKDGAMKSLQAQLKESFNKISTALAAYAFNTPNATFGTSDCSISGSSPYCRLLPATLSALAPYGIQADDLADPWGRPFRYSPLNTLTTST